MSLRTYIGKVRFGPRLGLVLAITVICGFTFFADQIMTSGPPPEDTKVSEVSEQKAPEASPKQPFEDSTFCEQYACTDAGKLEYPDGCTEYYYAPNLPQTNAELSVVGGENCQNRSYHLRLEALDIDSRPGDQWEDPQVVFDFLESVTGEELNTVTRKSVMQKLEQQVPEHICNAKPIDLEKFKAWIGRVPRLQQTILVADQCR